MITNNDLQQMPAIDECYVKISDLKKAIDRNPYDPEKGNITAYLRYLKYNTPLSDVVPIRHAYWLTAYFDKKFWANYCSECRNYLPYGYDWKPNFCPVCGSKMNQEVHDE